VSDLLYVSYSFRSLPLRSSFPRTDLLFFLPQTKTSSPDPRPASSSACPFKAAVTRSTRSASPTGRRLASRRKFLFSDFPPYSALIIGSYLFRRSSTDSSLSLFRQDMPSLPREVGGTERRSREPSSRTELQRRLRQLLHRCRYLGEARHFELCA
jgi:hypothetical protein